MNLTRLTQYWFRGCISAKLWSIKTKLVMHHQHHDMRAQAKVGNSATYGSWDYQQFTFWLITFEQSVRKLKYLCLWIPCVVPNQKMSIMPGLIEPPVGHFEICHTFSYLLNLFDISSQKSVGIINIMSWTYHRSMKTAPPTVREILRSLKKRLTFTILSQICTFDVILFLGLCWFWKCLICHFPKQRLSAILK